MRLYLSSFQLGTAQDEFAKLIGANRRTAIIGNAMDMLEGGGGRERRIASQAANLSALGCACEELDLRRYFGRSRELADRLCALDLIWVAGGNSFVLKRAFEQSGCDRILASLLQQDAIVYGGFSAALMMVAPTLRGIEFCDDPDPLPSGYKAAFSWDGLGLTPYSIIPHFRSNHPASEAIRHMVAYMEKQGLPYRTLRDGEVVVVDGEEIRFSGRPYNYFPDQAFGLV